MDYCKVIFDISLRDKEVLIGLLSQLAFESFEEPEEGLIGYIQESLVDATFRQELEKLQKYIAFHFDIQQIPQTNWNAVWEANFEAIQVGNFCGIRADFHPPFTGVAHELLINPKMAFGTGHHETTYMMIAQMRELEMKGKKVLDYGCGTGILSILAAKCGASIVDAVDIEKAAYENTLENCQLNDVYAVQALYGSLNVILDTDYEIILANINKNVLLDSLQALYNKLSFKGVLLLSGILQPDEPTLIKEAQRAGFTLDEIKRRGEWSCLKLLQ